MFGTLLVFLLLSANLNAQPTEVENSEVAQKVAERIEFLEMELQTMYDRHADSEDILEAQNQLSTLYSEQERESLICTGCKKSFGYCRHNTHLASLFACIGCCKGER